MSRRTSLVRPEVLCEAQLGERGQARQVRHAGVADAAAAHFQRPQPLQVAATHMGTAAASEMLYHPRYRTSLPLPLSTEALRLFRAMQE